MVGTEIALFTLEFTIHLKFNASITFELCFKKYNSGLY